MILISELVDGHKVGPYVFAVVGFLFLVVLVLEVYKKYRK